MDSSLKVRFERPGPVRDVGRVSSGSSAVFVLRPALDADGLRSIDAAHALARRGISLLRAKRTTEAVLEDRRVFVELPAVEDPDALVAELGACGIAATHIEADMTVDVRALRERLDLTREQFAMRFGLEVETVRNWETGKRAPDATARSYLRVIAAAPDQVEQAYAASLQP